jgi:hypothetical protein
MTIPATMKALIQLHEGYSGRNEVPHIETLEPYLAAAEIAVPEPGEGEVLIKVAMAAINPSDLHFIKGEYGQPRRKGVPAGFEGVGEVVKAKGAYGESLVGKRVAFTVARTGSGAWADYAVTDATTCIPVRPDMRDEDAAAHVVNPMTAMAMFDIVKKSGAKSFVMTAGASQVSKLMLSLGKEQGIVPIVTVRRADQVAYLKDLGAGHVLVETDADFMEQKWWDKIAVWRGRKCLAYRASDEIIKPQYAIQRLQEAVKGTDVYFTTEVGQHQMWAAQFLKFDEPNRWMTSGGLGTMGYGIPAAVGVQMAHPNSLVIDIAGEASVMMTMQEISTAVQYRLPIKIFILNNHYMGMVRQWQELLHGGRYSESYSEALPDFVKLADAMGGVGIRCEKPSELDEKIAEMIAVKRPVIFDCVVDPAENCFPMIPSGKAHNEMLFGEAVENIGDVIDEKGKMLV